MKHKSTENVLGVTWSEKKDSKSTACPSKSDPTSPELKQMRRVVQQILMGCNLYSLLTLVYAVFLARNPPILMSFFFHE